VAGENYNEELLHNTYSSPGTDQVNDEERCSGIPLLGGKRRAFRVLPGTL
jgi:hypothetical protein